MLLITVSDEKYSHFFFNYDLKKKKNCGVKIDFIGSPHKIKMLFHKLLILNIFIDFNLCFFVV